LNLLGFKSFSFGVLEILSAGITIFEGLPKIRLNHENFTTQKTKIMKIVLGSPPHSGKSCLREGLKQAIMAVPKSPYS